MDIQSQIASRVEMPIVTNLGKYLGMPLLTKRKTTSDYQPIPDRVQNQIRIWQSKLISQVGRLTLIKSVLSPLTYYPMQTTILPRGITTKIDQVTCGFLLGDTVDSLIDSNQQWNLSYLSISLPVEVTNFLYVLPLPYIRSSLPNSLIWNHNSGGRFITHDKLKSNAFSHATKFFFLSTRPTLPSQKYVEEVVRWIPALIPHITINTDDSSRGNLGPSGVGGLARSASGSWLWGFLLRLGFTNNTMAELWGIRSALLLAWNRGYRGVTFQTDSLLETKWLTTNIEVPVEFSNLWETRVEHVWREANNCVDVLAKWGVSQPEEEILYNTCPTFLWKCFGTRWGLQLRRDGLHLPDVFMVSCLAYICQQIVDYIAINQVILASSHIHTPTSIDGHQDQVETTLCGKQEAEAKGAAIKI
ncbi:putative ribonuclease h protein [Quercus suber]|uniref:Ribonuclease h protein n=1 Tax=Quercus suber TaxID=58331 RepID=A0AAW0INX6_QUESU